MSTPMNNDSSLSPSLNGPQNSRRSFCKTSLATGIALAFGQSSLSAFATQAECDASTIEQGFANSFVNVPEQFGPSEVRFNNPLPEGLRGTLFRNGPARMIAEEKAGRFLWGGFGTALQDSQPVFSPDDLNVANISVLPVGDEVLALWEAGSPYRVHAETLETLGRLVLSPETDGLPFSAHPRVDPQGRIWNFGYSLNRTAIIEVPNADMVHDFAITEDYLVFVLQPLRFNPLNNASSSFRESLTWDAEGSVEVVVVDKQTLSITHQFQLPPFFAFHLGNAWQDGESIRIEVATADQFDPLMDAIELAMLGKRAPNAWSTQKTIEIKLVPRYDQRFTGQRTDHLFMLSQSANMPNGVLGFDSITAMNRNKDAETVFSYGGSVLAEEHIFVPAPGETSGKGWLVGTSYNWKTCCSSLSVFNAESIEDGPIAQAELPYGLPMGLHGQFVAT